VRGELHIESARKRIPRGLPQGKRVKRKYLFLLKIGDSPQLAVELFNSLLTSKPIPGAEITDHDISAG
jgi:hypothetical protein